MKRVVFTNKGGVGKTSIACNLAAISAAEGYRTLLVDLDAQANATQYLTGCGPDDTPSGIADFFRQTLFPGSGKAQANVHPTPFDNFFLIAGSPELAELQPKLEAKFKIRKLAKLLDRLAADYDRIYLDTPPGFGFYSLSALLAADRCLVPFDCDSFSLTAIDRLLAELEDIADDHDGAAKIEGVVVNQFPARGALPEALIAELEQRGIPVFDERLMSSVKMKESHHACRPLIHLDPNHKLTRQFVALFHALED
ncbi:ParA family protein [Stutzerimonas azotifigens]|uniref:ParA family protein n=1 Tax=Stutzerimonas azotifigens TaxID=291995 RepID=UPI000422F9FF|nr:ParA family protein [Stutzerimonas azotifigens]